MISDDRAIHRWMACAALLGVLVMAALAGCGSGAGGGGSDATLPGTWSGTFTDDESVSVLRFAHPLQGNITVTFTESGGTVSGDISLDPDICDDLVPIEASSGPIAGTLTSTTLEFVYDTPAASQEELASVTEITFTADFPADPIEGIYRALPCDVDNWRGTFLLNKN